MERSHILPPRRMDRIILLSKSNEPLLYPITPRPLPLRFIPSWTKADLCCRTLRSCQFSFYHGPTPQRQHSAVSTENTVPLSAPENPSSGPLRQWRREPSPRTSTGEFCIRATNRMYRHTIFIGPNILFSISVLRAREVCRGRGVRVNLRCGNCVV